MSNACGPDNVDWGFPVNWSEPLNRLLVSWYLAVPKRMGFGTNRMRDMCIRNNGTLTNFAFPNTATSGWNGPAGRPGGFGSLAFDGTDDYVGITTGPVSGNTPRTVTFWMNQTSRANNVNSSFVSLGPTSGLTTSNRSFDIQFAQVGGSVYLYTDSVLEAITVSGSQIPSLGVWHHVAFSYDGGTGYVYHLDGVVAKSGSFAAAAQTGTGPVSLGRRINGATGYSTGSLDSVRIYSRALSAAEVSALYAEEKAGYPRTLNRIRRYGRVSPALAGLLLRRRRALT